MAPTPPEPEWPADEPGKVLLHLDIGANVDKVFEDIFGCASKLQVREVYAVLLHAQLLRSSRALIGC